LAAQKGKPSKFKMTVGTDGRVHVLEENSGSMQTYNYGKGDAAAKKDNLNQMKINEMQYKMMDKIATVASEGDEGRKKDYMGLLSMTSGALNLDLTQIEATGVLQEGIRRWENDVNDKANWNPFVSVSDAKGTRLSITPYLTAQVLGTPDSDKAAMTDFGQQLAGLNGGNSMSEAQWGAVMAQAQAVVAETHTTGREAMAIVLERIKARMAGK